MEESKEVKQENTNQSKISRRSFLRIGRGLAIGLGITSVAGGLLAFTKPAYGQYLRPPGARREDEFMARCIRCFQCGQICPANTINFLGVESGLALDTPYINDISKYPCILCMKCTQICPTQALVPVQKETDDIISKVKLGQFEIDTTRCPLYIGKLSKCHRCYYSCPLKDKAIVLNQEGKPEITDECVGCGICLQACPFGTINYV